MEKIKSFFEFIDRFDIPISFRYQKDDRYSTFIGGFFSFVKIVLSLISGIYLFIPFAKKENYSFTYYITNLNETEEINLRKTKSSLAFRLDCSSLNDSTNYERLEVNDLLEFNVKYIFYTNDGEEKNTQTIGIHNCDMSDFYNNINLLRSLDKNKLSDLKCLDDLNKVIKNRYQDKNDNFTYFQIDVEVKDDKNISQVKNYLLNKDCKVELYYIDVKIEINDYEEPIKPFFNEIFLQLNPYFQFKMNTYFMNEYFESHDDLFFEHEGKEIINSLFSRTEQYFLNIESTGENAFAKIYIRADTKKIEIERTYQNLLEFFADSFSFWEVIFIICELIFCPLNRISLSYLIQKELFFFKEKKDNKYFNVSQKAKQIENLIKLTNLNNQVFFSYQNDKNDNNINFNTENSITNIGIPNAKDNNVNNKKKCKSKFKCNRLKFLLIKIMNIFKCK